MSRSRDHFRESGARRRTNSGMSDPRLVDGAEALMQRGLTFANRFLPVNITFEDGLLSLDLRDMREIAKDCPIASKIGDAALALVQPVIDLQVASPFGTSEQYAHAVAD